MNNTSLFLGTAIFFTGLICGLSGIAAETSSPARPPNFVIIFADDLGYQDVGCFGSPDIRTPRLDAMAQQGTKFTSFYAQPICGPSRAAIMTGCYPLRVAERGNVKQVHPVLHSDEVTVAELLKTKGYATACFGKWDLATHSQTGFFMDLFPTRQGFDYFFGTPTSNDGFVNLFRNEELIEPKSDMSTLTRRYTDEAIAFMKDHREQPFFVYIPHTMPHTRLDASAAFKGKSPRGLYGDVVEEIDFNAGRLLDAITNMGLEKDTYVLFTSDNGPWLIKNQDLADGHLPRDHGGSAGPLRSGKVSTFEGGLRVPTVLWGPGRVPAGARCDQIASTLDLLPTLAALAGAAAPTDRTIDGEDIRHLFHGQFDQADPDKAFFYYLRVHLQAVRQGKWKLHLVRDAQPIGAAPFRENRHIAPADRVGFDTPFLVDLDADLGETTNVADQHPDVVQRLLALAEAMRDDLGDYDRVGRNMRFFDSIDPRPSKPPVPPVRQPRPPRKKKPGTKKMGHDDTKQSRRPGEAPNVLFLALDDMNDWLGCYGGHPDIKSPHIDRLARRGVLFTNAHCVSPICGPSRAAVLTGLRPETTGVYHNQGTYIDYVPDAVTFPEHFRSHGYHTLAAGKINHGLGEADPRLWDENGPDCGVLGTPFIDDELDTTAMVPHRRIERGRLRITLPANGGLSAIDRPNNRWDSFDWAPLDVPDGDFPDGKIAAWGVEQLKRKHDQPFLLALGFYKPHQPFFAPREYFDLYDSNQISLPTTIVADLSDVPQPGRDLATKPWTSGTHQTVMEHGAWPAAVHAYLATVSFVDAQVGRVIDALDRSRYADDTWIVLWSDHGWSLGEKEHWGKHVPWCESVRMPLMIVPPKNAAPEGFTPGTRCDAPVSLLDLYPTLTSACGLPRPPKLEGRSLIPMVGDPAASDREAVVSTVGRGTHSVFTRKWRYVRYFDGSEELYDLQNDPAEWSNLARDGSHALLKQRLAAHIPTDHRFERFVRYGRWKCVFPVDGAPLLFDYNGEFGISEQNNLAEQHADVITAIRSYLSRNEVTDRYVTMPAAGSEEN